MKAIDSTTRAMLVALALFMEACASPFKPMRSLAISPDFSPEEIEAIVLAADDWCGAGVRCVGSTVTHKRRGGSIAPHDKCRNDKPADTKLRFYAAPHIRICEHRGREQLRWLVRHELGHAFALSGDHLGDGNTMGGVPRNPQTAAIQDPGVTESDREYVLR